jgi:hypothetical protein
MGNAIIYIPAKKIMRLQLQIAEEAAIPGWKDLSVQMTSLALAQLVVRVVLAARALRFPVAQAMQFPAVLQTQAVQVAV